MAQRCRPNGPGREARCESDDASISISNSRNHLRRRPRCKSQLKIIGPEGGGKVSWALRAIGRIQQWNQYGRRLLSTAPISASATISIPAVRLRTKPLCVEVNRLVRSGVSVVVSAGNGGYSSFITSSGASLEKFSDMSITDPGNAELAITTGSTHREMPHTYGVSYFSSRGPTGDGRLKPDLLAPGERIISCAAGRERNRYAALSPEVLYCEQSGTSMAAPHVSGAIAAFLSVRPNSSVSLSASSACSPLTPSTFTATATSRAQA